MKKALVCGARGFIGGYTVKKLKEEGYWVRGVDLKYPLTLVIQRLQEFKDQWKQQGVQ
jgi:nucleoside-diphosphate-sugar epimerase